jgi:LCP family protein required for cell wall assembly
VSTLADRPGPTRPARPLWAASLSFVWPGLGQLAQRRFAVAALFAIPAVVLIIAIAARLVGRLELAAVTMLDPAFSGFVLVSIVALGLWRVAAIADAWRTGIAKPFSGQARIVLAALVAGVLVMHAGAAYYTWAFYDAGSRIFAGVDPSPSPGPTVAPSVGGSPGASEEPVPTPIVTYPPSDRISILLLGVDSGHDRDHALTDTMLVASLSPSQGTLTMISFPRDIARVPLYLGGTYNDKLNSLMTAARQNPKRFPDGPAQTLANELGYLLGIPIQYTAAINLDGFERMVNIVGGVDIVNDRQISDPTYDWFDGTFGFYLSAGKHHLNGRNALAYARSRKGAGDNDFTRADRQQEILLALRSKLTKPAALAKLPDLLDAASRSVTTNLPPDKLRSYLEYADEINGAKVQRFVLGPPYAVHPPTNTTGGTYILRLDLDMVRTLSAELFGRDSAYFDQSQAGAPSGSPSP